MAEVECSADLMPKKKMRKNLDSTTNVFTPQEEESLVDFLVDHEFLWNSKLSDYKRTDKKNRAWEDKVIIII